MNLNKKLAPLIIFCYNRPYHLKKVLESLRVDPLAKETDLHFFCDGPKNLRDKEFILQVRNLVQNVQGFKSIKYTFSDINLGLAASVISGVSKVLKTNDSAIILEDDLIVSPSFLTFMNNSLQTYSSRQDIFSVTGYNYPFTYPPYVKDSAYLSYRSSSWGWGTWSNRWERVDWGVANFKSFVKNRRQVEKFERGGEDLLVMLKQQLKGKIDSWSIRFDFAHFENEATCLHPIVSLVNNIGFDGSGAHGVRTQEFSVPITSKFQGPVDLNPTISVSQKILEPFDAKFRPKHYAKGKRTSCIKWANADLLNSFINRFRKGFN